MKTILLNGSPKGNVQSSGSYFLAKAFASGMKEPCEIRSVYKEDRWELLQYVSQFERIIFFTPNYIHLIPARTLDFLYALPKGSEGQSLGFIIQSGYPESAESEIAGRFFKRFASRLQYGYLGTVVKGECAGLAIIPEKFGKLEKKFAEFSALYEERGFFDETYVRDFAKPYTISKPMALLLNMTNPIGNILGWHKIMKANGAYDNRRDRPYLRL